MYGSPINKYMDSICILAESDNPSAKEISHIISVLEDGESPTSNMYVSKLYDSINEKSKIDYDNIPASKGDVDKYEGTPTMCEALNTIINLGQQQKSKMAVMIAQEILSTINNLRYTRDVYEKGYITNNNYVVTEYNILVYTCVNATSALIDAYVDFIKNPVKPEITNNPKAGRNAGVFYYYDVLKRFNEVFADTRNSHRKYLESLIAGGRDNFTGTAALGVATVAAAAIAVVPITRELVYQFYKIKSNLSDCLAQQAYFLELNKAAVEANTSFTDKKRSNILSRQEKVKNLMLKLSSKLRVDHIKATSASKQMLARDNRMLTLDNIEQEVNQAPLQLF